MSNWFDISKLKAFGAAAIASGKKNAPTIMTGGSIVLGWLGVYLFWQQSKKAEKKIEYEEEKLNYREPLEPERPHQDVPLKQKLVIYGEYCWPAAVCGLASTGLAIGVNHMNLSRLTEMALLTKFMTEKDSKQQELIEKLKGEVGDKKFLEMREEMLEEKYSEEEMKQAVQKVGPGTGKILFVDAVTHNRFTADILQVTSGIAKANSRLKDKRNKVISEKLGDAFYASGSPWSIDADRASDVYSSLNLNVFLQCIGEIPHDGNFNKCDLGDLLEFRYYGGGGDVLLPDQILSYKEYTDPESGYPVVCYLEYGDLLSPTSELIERNPM